MSRLDFTHDPDRRSWVASANAAGTPFPIQNLPFAAFSTGTLGQTIGIAIGGFILPAAPLFGPAMNKPVLNDVPAQLRRQIRQELSQWLADGASDQTRIEPLLIPMERCRFHLPFDPGDYTDFYASVEHAANVGKLFRPDNPLLPNYRWVPIAYHGRASTVVVSGTDIRRPWGQLSTAAEPSFAPSRELDFEMELGFWIGEGNRIGQRIPIAQASEAIFGYSLVNDWSARDIQRWEYQPLGPFLSKSFATSVSPFVITPEALAPFRVAARSRPEGEPQPLPYLHDPTDQVEGALDIQVETFCEGQCIAASNTRHLYWTPAQMVTHHASNGCSLRPGDLIASGTISGPEKEARGSLLEITRRGESPLKLADGRTRVFLEDGDEVVLSAWCHRQGLASIGFGQCQGRVLPSDGGLLRGV